MEDFDKKLKNTFGTEDGRKSFSVPENYFESFSERMSERIKEESQATEEVPVVSMWERCKPFVMLAALFSGVALMLVVPLSRMDLDRSVVVSAETPVFEEFIDRYYSEDQSFVEDLFADDSSTESYKSVSNEDIESYFVAELNSYEISMYDVE